ncbi:hypothetical protein [Endozoicomonas sp. ONNA2]|uniref:hypothetical protein n=1 Tax=Endozoicomonas sp. ONNA2 TaxID=2828741 RepID=UPI002148F961|nr:hypothetical protein [Endozoicomonas sp. ONNA2]
MNSITPASSITTNEKFERSSNNNTNNAEGQSFLPEIKQQYDTKHINEYNIIKKCEGTSKSPAESPIAHLPEALQLEIVEIKTHCNFNDNLIEILNGSGVFFNRLIILLKNVDHYLTQNGFSDKQRLEVKKTINLLLTGGTLDLVNDIGSILNHIEKSYQSGAWSPDPIDRHFFDQDYENRKTQNSTEDFYPQWMIETEIVPHIPASAATLAYWNFRHSPDNELRWKLNDTLMQNKDPGLFKWICELRKLKEICHKPDTGPASSPSSLTRFHIEAIAARLDYADKEANKNPHHDNYTWDDQTPCTRKRRKQKSKKRRKQPSDSAQAAGQTLNGKASDNPASSLKSVVEKKGKKPAHQTSGSSTHRPDHHDSATADKFSPRKRRRNSTYASYVNNEYSRVDNENRLKDTGIPELEKIIKSVLEEKEEKLSPALTTSEDYNNERAEVIAAQDELSRLYNACCYHCGIKKTSIKVEIEKTIAPSKTEQEKIADSLDEVDLPKPDKPPYSDKPDTDKINVSDIKPDFYEAQNALITLIEKSQKLSLQPAMKPEELQRHPEDLGDAPALQPLSTVLKLPMPFLSALFKLEVKTEGNKNPETTSEIKARVLKLVQDIKNIISLYRYNSSVWNPVIARENLNPTILKVREVQLCFSQIIAFKRKQQGLLKSIHHTSEDTKINEDQLKKTEEGLAKTAIVLSSLIDFSAYLKSAHHQELCERLLKAVKEWGSFVANIPLEAFRE